MRKPNLKNVLGKLRDTAGISAKELADMLDGKASSSLITKMESSSKKSNRSLTPEIAKCISEATGVSYEWLLEGNASKPIVTIDGSPYEGHSLNEYRRQLTTPEGFYDPQNLLWKRYQKARNLAQKKLGSQRDWDTEQARLKKKERRDYDLAVETETQKIIQSIPYPILERDLPVEAAIKDQIVTTGGLYLAELASLLLATYRNPKRPLVINRIIEFNRQLEKEFKLSDAISSKQGMSQVNKIHHWMSENLKKELAR